MQPGFDLRIRTMIKAMTKVVLPAIDPGNRAAIEQAQLVAASLDMLIEQVNYGHWYEVVDIRSHAQLARQLIDLAETDGAKDARFVMDAALGFADRDDVTLAEIREQGRLLRDSISALVEALMSLDDQSVGNTALNLVLAHSEAQIARERAYVAKTKFDVYPETLLPMKDVMSLPA